MTDFVSASHAPVPPRPDLKAGLVGSEVTEYIRSLIISGTLSAGVRLRVEHLARDIDISVTPVREALVELLSEGFVVRRPRRGYVVAEMTRRGLHDRVLVLALITGELTARAASRITSDQVATLEQIQAQLTAVDASGARLQAEELNHRLHSSINIAADSPELAWMAQRGTRYVPRVTWAGDAEIPRTCSYEHAEVLAALRNGQSEEARAAMTQHLIESGEMLARDLDGVLWPVPER
jgi:DNA-binding GntR family transcriptional regulator